jgi:hypothetical protein
MRVDCTPAEIKVDAGYILFGSMPPLKVLCLHGFMQNGSVFRARTGSFRKVLLPTPSLLHHSTAVTHCAGIQKLRVCVS